MQVEKYRKQLSRMEHELQERLRKTTELARERPVVGGVDIVDESVASEQKESAFSEADRDTQTLNEIRDALVRIEDGTYGRCAADGEWIEEARLEAVPWARFCVRHQELMEAMPQRT